ncbi:MAG: CCA tRNA nucleotidyltransferase [Rhodobacteraceae bacterium]|nr:CCA tRNA nucleotidyltransferase [Paracoccaceae bacterium]
MSMLTEAGHEAWFVGGCVRNALLGEPVSDLDISTNARPEVVIALAEAAGLKAVPTGIEHGTITVVSGGQPFEITTFRRDVETDGRRAVVAFADTLEEDAQRRDFTMNALYANAAGEVSDPVGGLPDLHARHFRFIGDAKARIREDYLRILRFFRFFAWYGSDLDTDGLSACAALADGIETLSAERVTSEMLKLLSAPDPLRAVGAMEQTGILAQVLPGATGRMLGPFILLDFTNSDDPIARLAALGGDAGTLRLSKADSRALDTYRNACEAPLSAAEFGYRLGQETGLKALALSAATLERPLTPEEVEAAATGAAAVFPVKAADLPAMLQGREIGAALKRLEAAWIAAGFAPTKAELLAKL